MNSLVFVIYVILFTLKNILTKVSKSSGLKTSWEHRHLDSGRCALVGLLVTKGFSIIYSCYTRSHHIRAADSLSVLPVFYQLIRG